MPTVPRHVDIKGTRNSELVFCFTGPSNEAVITAEIEFIFELTAPFMKHLLRLNGKRASRAVKRDAKARRPYFFVMWHKK